MSAPPQVVQLACPNCRTPVRAQVFTLLDIGRQPALKSLLVSGQLNTVVCPSCGYVSMLAAPIAYHDPAKQLFLVHFPQQLNASAEEQERFVGDATSFLMRSLPQETPRGYLLAPRRFFTLQSLVEAVLEADGITKEMIEAQRRRVELISQLAEAYESGDEALAEMVSQVRADLTPEFLTTLAAFADASARGGQNDSAEVLGGLYNKLAELIGSGEDHEVDEADDLESVVAQLRDADEAELDQLIGELRPMLDYEFFELWTSVIEQAEQQGDQAEAARLTARRALILERIEHLDQEGQAIFERSMGLLQQAVESEDPEAVLRAAVDQIDDAFLLVADANRAAAERVGQTELAERIETIRELAIRVVDESLTPEDRFINQLLGVDTPQAATALLRQNPDMVTPGFVKKLNEQADRLDQQGNAAARDQLRQLAREASVMLF